MSNPTRPPKQLRGGRLAETPWLGATVRLKRGKRTATVTSDNVIINNQRVVGGLRLDKCLGGYRYWNADSLVMVAPPQMERRRVTQTRKQLVHGIAICPACGWEHSAYRSVQRAARQHVMQTGHRVNLELGYSASLSTP